MPFRPTSDAEELHQRNRELTILNTIAQALNASQAISEALQTTLAYAAELFGLETGWVWLLREDSGVNYLAAAQNLPPALEDNPQTMAGGCYCLSTFQEGDLQGAANVNVVQCSRLKWLVEGTNGLAFHASVPLTAHGRKLGILNLASQDWRELSAADLRILRTIGDMVGIAIERAQLFDKQHELGAIRERNRLAREIHDTLAQGLTALILQLESAETLLEQPADPERIQPIIDKALALARDNLIEARRSVMDLRTAPLAGKSLAAALADLAEPDVQLKVTGGDPLLPSSISAGLYRIAQEALTNARRHASANQIKLQLTQTPTQVTLIIEDDGVGFNPDTSPENRYGIIGLSERAHLLGGNFDLETSPGEGTRITVRILLNKTGSDQ